MNWYKDLFLTFTHVLKPSIKLISGMSGFLFGKNLNGLPKVSWKTPEVPISSAPKDNSCCAEEHSNHLGTLMRIFSSRCWVHMQTLAGRKAALLAALPVLLSQNRHGILLEGGGKSSLAVLFNTCHCCCYLHTMKASIWWLSWSFQHMFLHRLVISFIL